MLVRKQAELVSLGAAALMMMALVTSAQPRSVGAKKGDKAQQQAPVFGQLYPGEKHELPIHGWRPFIDPVECDANGNMYMLMAANLQAVESSLRGQGALAVTKIKPDSGNLTQFNPASPPGYEGYVRPSFYVGPRGTVYALVEAYKHPLVYHEGPNIPDVMVVKYTDDGTVDSVTKLDPPPELHLSAYGLAAFPDGSFLLTGYLVSGTPGVSKHLVPTKPFTWIFARSGAFESPVALSDDVHPPDKNWAKEGPKGFEWILDVQHSGILGAIDGTVYLYRASDPVRLYAVSSGGSIFREVTIKPPEPGMRPMQASLAGNRQILIEFRGEPSPKQMGPSPMVLTLADLETGAIGGNYKIPPSAGTPACAAPGSGFFFLNMSEQENMQVQTFAPM